MNRSLLRVISGAAVTIFATAPGSATNLAAGIQPIKGSLSTLSERPVRPAVKRSIRVAGSVQRVLLTGPTGCEGNGTPSFTGIPLIAGNAAGGSYSGVAAGGGNAGCDTASFIGAGESNIVGGGGGGESAILAGLSNGVIGEQDFIGAGLNNLIVGGAASTQASAIGGGDTNAITGDDSFIGAGAQNSIYLTRGAGYGNAFIGAGESNSVAGDFSSIVAGFSNSVASDYAIIAGGSTSSITGGGAYSSILGGFANSISGEYSVIGGGFQNDVAAEYGVVCGGNGNSASGLQSFIGGGYGNKASGKDATIPGGTTNTASGTNSFAAGTKSTAGFTGDFVWSDYVSGSSGVSATAAGQFVARATGGFYLYSSKSLTGVALAPGSGSWSTLSDRDSKTAVAAIDEARILASLAKLPVSEWSYTAEGLRIRHVGPMAQDFRAAFGVGEDDRHIATVDEEGIALAAIKALQTEVDRKNRELATMRRTVENVRRSDDVRFAQFEQRLEALEGRNIAASRDGS